LLAIWRIADEWPVACDDQVGIMTPRCRHAFPLVLFLALCTVTRVRTESLIDEPPKFCQVRTTDRRISSAVEIGLRDSPTFRELVNRINASDVVVYVTADASELPPGLDGQLTFLSATGGFRYVVVRVNSKLSAARLVALLGHELQHAREVADSDAIVDSRSMAHAYAARLGYHNRADTDGHTFDSVAAVRAGEQVLRELLTGE
jgi:hypothetical protein